MKYTNKALDMVLARAFAWEARRSMIQRWIGYIDSYGDDKQLRDAYAVVYGKLYEQESQAWKEALFLALGSEIAYNRVKKLAYKRFCSDDMQIMHMLSPSGKVSVYESKVEDAFREELRIQFGVQDDSDKKTKTKK